MSNATCKTCPYFTQNDYGREHNRGECRCHAPVVIELPGEYLNFPVMEPDDWCGEHPDRQPVFLAELKTAETKCLMRGDVITIVAQQIETEMKARKR